MSNQLWSQDIFSKGELSPYMYARATVNEYGNGLKTAQNVLTYPTGAAGKRFGTLFQSILSGFTSTNEIYFETFQYLNECTYQVLFAPLAIYIYLEGILVATVVTTFPGPFVVNISSSVIGSNFQISAQGIKPTYLQRSPNAGNIISSVSLNQFNLTTPVVSGLVVPVQFTTTGTLPTTNQQIIAGVTYFVKYTSVSTASLYTSAYNAKFGLSPLTIIDNGTGTNTLIALNTWSIATVAFKNRPVYDFNGGYDTITFTPSAVTGNAVTLTSSAPIFTLAHIGGAFFGSGGSARITAFGSTTSVTIAIQNPFDSTTPILGILAVLAEPAWSDTRGWPQVNSSYQNRSLYANTTSLPNGFWASSVNDYIDFNDLSSNDDDAISWYPTSSNINYIRFIVPYRSVTVHTNTGIYSSPLSDVVAITPSNFTLQLQDSTPADVVQPQAIDNQVLVLSGNDAHQMLWDGINNAYTSDIVSVISEQTIRNPVDEVAFADLKRAGSRYVFIINDNGTMAIYQTLISQNVSGFTPQVMNQSYGSSKFIQAGSSTDGRCWFIIQRQIAQAVTAIAITASSATTLTAISSNFSTTVPTAVTFTTSGFLPDGTPPLELDTYYWAIGTTPDEFKVYVTQEDALSNLNEVEFNSEGLDSNVIAWPLATIFTLEELSQDVYLDCAVYYNSTPSDTINTGILFNAQSVKMVGNGFGFDAIGVNNEVNFEAHGLPTQVSQAYIGFPINMIIEPMPLSIANGSSAKNTTLTRPKHIRTVNFMFNNTIGGTINGVPIALNRFNQTNIGQPPMPQRGVFEMGVFSGWDDFNNPTYTIFHDDPFNIELLGVFYSVDT